MDALSGQAAALMSRIRDRQAVVGIIGMGYVGIPLAIAASRAGYPVLGFDIDTPRVEALNAGAIIIKHIPMESLVAARGEGRFEATSDFSRLREADCILIAVPTPLTRQREPDLSYVRATTQSIAGTLRQGQLIVLESTTWPGTTREVMAPILEHTGLKAGTDFFLAFSPEREDPGNLDFATSSIPKVVGGEGPEALALATALYDRIVVRTVPVSSAATAEAVKLTENIFRSVNIALVNELKVVFSAMDIDVWEVIDAASTKPFGFMPFYPGPGLGGHCIPIDPFYLTWKAREYDVATRFIELAGEINTRMPYRVIASLAEALDRSGGRGLSGARILIVGLAYKKNIEDVRESPALKLFELLLERGAEVSYHDPYVPAVPMTREHARIAGRVSTPLDPGTVAAQDAVLIATDHDSIDYVALAGAASLVVDTRNVCARNGLTGPHIVKA